MREAWESDPLYQKLLPSPRLIWPRPPFLQRCAGFALLTGCFLLVGWIVLIANLLRGPPKESVIYLGRRNNRTSWGGSRTTEC